MKYKLDREEIRGLLSGEGKPLNLNTIMHRLKIPRQYRAEAKKTVKELAREGKVNKKGNKFFTGAGGPSNVARGKVELKNNFGFLLAEEGEDIFLGREATGNLLPGDEVEVYVRKSRKGGREGALKSIIQRTRSPLMCRVKKIGPLCFAVLTFKDNPVIKLKEGCEGLEHGDIVLLRVEEKNNSLSGEVISRFFDKDDIKIYKQFILDKYEVGSGFPRGAVAEAEALDFNEKETAGRADLRGETIITIDPYDAKDFDDAVSLKKDGDIYRLGVHIADVAHYVRTGSQIDAEARERGTSVYLPGEAIPMLPEKLSNGVCSLREGEDKMTFSVFMEIDGRGEVVSYDIKESVIRNAKRFTYEEVEDILLGISGFKDEKITGMLKLMNELRVILKEKFRRGGNIDFTLGEPTLTMDDEGRVTDIKRKNVLDSHKVIEYFMISANICAADRILRDQNYGMFRVHPPPVDRDIYEFNQFLKALGIDFHMRKGTNREFQEALVATGDPAKNFLLERNLLRAMQLATYSEKNIGHFGLGLKRYTHFTSPIRRYADLVVHRIIKKMIGAAGGDNPERGELKKTAAQISDREEKSEKAENEVFRVYALDFLKNKVGQACGALITKVTKNGLLCELADYPVEGLLSFDTMEDDYYIFDQERLLALGRRTKKIYRTGDTVSAIIMKVDMESQKMELELDK
jgi:ribonuclease R